MIVALVVAIVGMSIGFATFSTILTISSKATVNPNRDSQKLVIYGLVNEGELEKISSDDRSFDFDKWSTTEALLVSENGFLDDYVVIDNNNFTISDLSVNFSLEKENIGSAFLLRNEGSQGVYITDLVDNRTKVCTALDNTTQSLVDVACDKLNNGWVLIPSKGVSWRGYPHFLEAGDYILMHVAVNNLGITTEVDGPFEVVFSDIELHFSDVLPETE